jgi:PmbA protein
MVDLGSMVQAVMERLSQKRLDAYEVYATSSRGFAVEVKDGKVDVFSKRDNAGLSVRVLKEQKPGFAYSTDLLPEKVPQLVEQVVQGAGASDPDAFLGFPGPASEPPPKLDQFDESLEAMALEDKINKARALESVARTSDPRIKKVRKAAYAESTDKITVCNHKGIQLAASKTLVSGSIMVVAEEGDDAESGWDYGFSPFFDELQMDRIGRTAAARAVSLLGARPIKSMRVPALFPPWVSSDVLSVLSESFMADNLQKGKSMLVGQQGKQVFSPQVTVVDDGLHPGGIGSSPFDDEGSYHERNVLVAEGVVQGFLYDQYTASKESRYSTGNAGRHGIKVPPSVQATNFFIDKGPHAPDDLLASLHKGLMVTDIIGLHTADPISGDFSIGAAGLWIEQGESRFPVKGIAISGNLMDLASNVDGVGSDLTLIQGPSLHRRRPVRDCGSPGTRA